MHMKEDHMQNSQLKPGYNIQLSSSYGFRQFLLRGNRKVKTEILLLAMTYNINKYHAKIQQNRTGRQLFENFVLNCR